MDRSTTATPPAASPKLVDRAQAVERANALPRPLVFTNGVFDLLHRGHVENLAAARALGASLVVALNGDASARRLDKGPGRPVNREQDRAAVVAALESVSMVVLFEEDTPASLLRELRPDVYAKGGDYDIDALEESRLVRAWGGRAVALPYRPGCSTTGIVQRVIAAHAEVAA